MKHKFLLLVMFISQTIYAQSIYKADWNSLVNYKAPEWYEDAKIGFWTVWGVYSVPAFKGDHAAEWYGRWMYCQKGQSSRNDQGYSTHIHHINKYGEPSKFGYKDFIPMFKAEKFNPDEWADLCVKGGAKFFTFTAVFHDAFCMWNSNQTKWNSVNMGPHRDLVADTQKAMKKRGLKFGVSNHSGWNYCFYEWNHINRYDAINKDYQDLYGNPIVQPAADTIRMYPGETRNHFEDRSRGAVKPSERDLTRWLQRANELVDLYQPDLYYFDWGFNIDPYEPYRRAFAEHYYNKSVKREIGTFGNPGVVINYKSNNTFKKGSGVRDIERGGMNGIQDMVWQTDDCVYGGNNWGYAENEPIKPTDVIVDELMDIISKRGVLMLAFAPKADGTFPEDQKQMIRELGSWLKVCGEAVYSTRPYKILGEQSANWGAKDETGYKTYYGTKDDIRYTQSKDHKILYATILDWPGNNIIIKTLSDLNPKGIKSISMVGGKKNLKWKMTTSGLYVNLGSKPNYNFAYPIRIEFK